MRAFLAAAALSLLACGEPRSPASPSPTEVVIFTPPGSPPALAEVASSAPGDDDPCRRNGRCSVEGRCFHDGTRCVADSDASCRGSLSCELFGRCEHAGDRCVGTDAGCRASLTCRQHGHCALVAEYCRDESKSAALPEPTIISPAMRSALDRPFDAAWIVGRWQARPPPEGPDSFLWQADLEVRRDGSFELTEGQAYPNKDVCAVTGDVRIAAFVMIQRIRRSSCPDLPPGTLRSFAVFPEADELIVNELFIGGSLQATGYYRREGRTG